MAKPHEAISVLQLRDRHNGSRRVLLIHIHLLEDEYDKYNRQI